MKKYISALILVIGVILLSITPSPVINILGYSLQWFIIGVILAFVGFIALLDYI